jgi:hypothetical protein
VRLLDVRCGRRRISTVDDGGKESKTAKEKRIGKDAAEREMARERMRKSRTPHRLLEDELALLVLLRCVEGFVCEWRREESGGQYGEGALSSPSGI